MNISCVFSNAKCGTLEWRVLTFAVNVFCRKKKKAEGYPEGEVLLYRPVNASEFIRSQDYVDLLANTSQVSCSLGWRK